MSLHIETEHVEKEATVSVKGDVTIQTSPELRNALQPLFASNLEVVRVILNDVKFMDSSGIATLVEGLQWSKTSGGRFVLAGLSETVRDVFELAKLDTIFEIEG
ncbi:STAS domain-containing protein [Ghiorsea bivora]|uniref:STAS domain-containing protein n=1 Tax=Ghiorsea bivora TaxID=1485545 RepID=UPI00056DC132|nr:STAS domain-containing protein [Ghiorsea bivora]